MAGSLDVAVSFGFVGGGYCCSSLPFTLFKALIQLLKGEMGGGVGEGLLAPLPASFPYFLRNITGARWGSATVGLACTSLQPLF